MVDLEADPNKNVTFLHALASPAISRKCEGNWSVNNSIKRAVLNATVLINRHFLISSSKFFPYLPANSIPPSGPTPSFRAKVSAAAAIEA